MTRKKKRIDKIYRPHLEKKALEVILLSQQKKDLEAEIKSRKEEIRTNLEELKVDGYDGKDAKIRILIRSGYEVPLEKAISLVSLEDLRKDGLLVVRSKSVFEKYLKEHGIEAEINDYAIAKPKSVDVKIESMPKRGTQVSKDY